MSIFGIGKSHKPADNVERLTTIYDFGTRSVIESILTDAGIPYIIKDCGGSLPVITGNPMLGADFYVNVNDLEAAKALINNVNDNDVEADDDSETDDKQ